METASAVPVGLTPVEKPIENNAKPGQFDSRYIIRVEAQLQKLMDVKARSIELEDRKKQTKETMSSTVVRVINIVVHVINQNNFLIAIAAMVITDVFFLEPTFLIIAFGVIVFSTATIVVEKFICFLGQYDSFSKLDTSGLFFRDSNEESLCDIDSVVNHCCFFGQMSENHKSYYFLWILMDLQELERINKKPRLSKCIDKLYLKMHELLASKLVIQGKISEYAKKLDDGKVEYCNAALELKKYEELKRKVSERSYF
ncbi:MAG: hypothetical protein KAG53_08290 [Endozoicomonadaceae bacterium]|nr:hypothetical protein [Endozoicomonadaceae bacterium]